MIYTYSKRNVSPAKESDLKNKIGTDGRS
jgi:hypothetical protein